MKIDGKEIVLATVGVVSGFAATAALDSAFRRLLPDYGDEDYEGKEKMEILRTIALTIGVKVAIAIIVTSLTREVVTRTEQQFWPSDLEE